MYTSESMVHMYTHIPLALLIPLADSPSVPLFAPFAPSHLLGTLLAVTGSVHLVLRLFVN